MKKNGFKLNKYDPCIANKMVNGKQCTVCWHVDDSKIPHKDAKVVDEVIELIRNEFGDITIHREKRHTLFLLSTLGFPKNIAPPSCPRRNLEATPTDASRSIKRG